VSTPTAAIVGPSPAPTVSDGSQQCIEIQFSGSNPPWTAVITDGANIVTITSPGTLPVTVNSGHPTFTLLSVTDANGCTGTVSGSATFNVIACAAAQTFNAASDFSLINGNPNGVWSYGFSTTLAGPPTLDMHTSTTYICTGIEAWHTIISSIPLPAVYHNNTCATLACSTFSLAPRQLAFHPGPNCEFSIVRFTAPCTGIITINAAFSGQDTHGPDAADVHVLHNGVSLLSGFVNGFGPGTGPSLSTTLAVNSGDTIDFAVGCGSNGTFYFDTTGLDTTITSNFNESSICGKKFYDANANGIDDDGQVVPGWKVVLTGTDANGPVGPLTQYTDASGQYCFSCLLPGGAYTVTEMAPNASWLNATPTSAGSSRVSLM